MARADKTNGERELKPLPDTLSGGDLWFLGSVLGSHRKNWPKDSGPRHQGLGVSMSRLSVPGRASQESGSLLVLVRD